MSNRPFRIFKSKSPTCSACKCMWSDLGAPHYCRNHCPTDVQRTKRKFFTFQPIASPVQTSKKENNDVRSPAYLLYLIFFEESSWNTTKTNEMLITPQHLGNQDGDFPILRLRMTCVDQQIPPPPVSIVKTNPARGGHR